MQRSKSKTRSRIKMIGVNWAKTTQPLMKLEQLVSFHWATGVPCAFLLRSWAVLFLLGMKYDRRCPQSGYKDKETPPKRTQTDVRPGSGIIVITLQCCQISYGTSWVILSTEQEQRVKWASMYWVLKFGHLGFLLFGAAASFAWSTLPGPLHC